MSTDNDYVEAKLKVLLVKRTSLEQSIRDSEARLEMFQDRLEEVTSEIAILEGIAEDTDEEELIEEVPVVKSKLTKKVKKV